MPYTGGQIQEAQVEAAANRRIQLEAHLRGMEERYARLQRAGQAQHPHGTYLKQCINDLRRTLVVK